jgi:hypothetical protein
MRSAVAMASDLDIWRAANLLIRKHGANAELEAAKRADLMLDRGDDDGRLLWVRIRRAIEDLQTPSAGRLNFACDGTKGVAAVTGAWRMKGIGKIGRAASINTVENPPTSGRAGKRSLSNRRCRLCRTDRHHST